MKYMRISFDIFIFLQPLFRLPKLRLLDLSDNNLISIPSEIAQLVSLVELNLSRNDISDLPEQMKECKTLMILDLSSNPITRLPETISQCVSLTHLALNDVSLTQLPVDIGHLSHLRSLEVRENLIRTLPASITQLEKLQVLDLGQNELDLLPAEMGNLESLRELYIDSNDLEVLPDQIIRCKLLEQLGKLYFYEFYENYHFFVSFLGLTILDVSENRLAVLPEEFGDLDQLTDLKLSQNCLPGLPNSIGRLKKLSILKLEKNAIYQLTQSIGTCDQLTELFLTNNLLSELPSSIGNLRNLKNLNVDQNQLTAIPSTIGGCVSLSVLSLRENKISEIPMDIGKCERLTVLDLCNNRLSYLPFTINVLFKLQALWLSENQSQAMLKLQVERDPRTGVKVLTCYLLPQQSAQQQDPERTGQIRSFLGGPKVHFPDQDTTADEDKLPIGQFERHDTPHPKPQKLKKSSIDGHVIHHEGDHQVRPVYIYEPERSSENTQQKPSTPVRDLERSVAFSSDVTEASGGCRLKRINTPHYKGVRGALPSGDKVGNFGGVRSPSKDTVIRRIRVERDAESHLGLSIAGGLGSTPYREGDQSLFVSRVHPGGPADKAGLRVDDKLLRVNDSDVSSATHDQAVRVMHESRNSVELTVLRTEDTSPEVLPGGFKVLLVIIFHSKSLTSKYFALVTSVIFARYASGSPGFAVAGGIGSGKDGVFISYITPGGPADKQGKLAVGDRVLSINGTRMKGVRHDQAVALLTGHPNEDIYISVQRDRPSLCSPIPSTPLTTSSPNPTTAVSPQSPVVRKFPRQLFIPLLYFCVLSLSFSFQLSVSQINSSSSMSLSINQLGDTSSWDGKTEEVELIKEGKSLGLSVVGGVDHSSHPFGMDKPGVFISKISANSPAARSQRLRVGDRILSVNDRDVSEAKHNDAVEALKQSGSRVRIRITHDKQPKGLREVMIRRKETQPLGISIHGGVGSRVANQADNTDEGIFIERVQSGSVSDRAGLLAGQRIIEVNGESLLGCNKAEAAEILRDSNELRLLVCDGYHPSVNRTLSHSSVREADENGHQPSICEMASQPMMSSPHTVVTTDDSVANGEMLIERSSFSSDAPLATSSPLPNPPLIAPKPSRIPPAVAPKPTLKTSQVQNISMADNPNPEKLTFASKLKKFEQEIEVKRLDSKQIAATSLPPPEKRPLLSEDDIRKMKEEESWKS
uniref:Protein lap4 n=1 Tax=Heterorhabditis bacteriophora TaxID=37862 RepID=A0A1I7XFZ6_HETBA